MGIVAVRTSSYVRAGALVAVASAITLVVTHELIGAQAADLTVMAVTLLLTGSLGVVSAALAPRWFGRLGLRGQLVLLASLALGALVANMAVAAALMFISSHDLRLFFVLVGFALVATAGPVQIFSRRASERLQRVEAAAARIAAGELGARVEMAGTDEVARLASEFNRMADALQVSNARRDQLEAARRELFASVSHDLRTPLSSIQVMVEALIDGVVSDEETSRRYFATMSAEIDHLSLLIDDLFELAKLDSGELQLRVEALHLEEILDEAVALFQPQLDKASISLRFEHPEITPLVSGDRTRLLRVVQNLLSNALRHTPGDGTIELQALARDGAVQVAIRDSGEGIAAEDAPHVFDRFFRGERSRPREHGGSGLGLTIARAIVEAHGGRIWVEQGTTPGASIVFTVPAATDTAVPVPGMVAG